MPLFGKTFFALALAAGAVHVFRKDLIRVAGILRKPLETFVKEVAENAKDATTKSSTTSSSTLSSTLTTPSHLPTNTSHLHNEISKTSIISTGISSTTSLSDSNFKEDISKPSEENSSKTLR